MDRARAARCGIQGFGRTAGRSPRVAPPQNPWQPPFPLLAEGPCPPNSMEPAGSAAADLSVEIRHGLLGRVRPSAIKSGLPNVARAGDGRGPHFRAREPEFTPWATKP